MQNQHLQGATNGAIPNEGAPFSITQQGIKKLTQESEQDIIVQLISTKKMKTTNRISCELSDGKYKIRAYITDQKIQESDNNSFIKITSYGLLSQAEKPVGIVVQNCQVIDGYDGILGRPNDYLKNRSQPWSVVPIQKQKLKSYIQKNGGTMKKQQDTKQYNNTNGQNQVSATAQKAPKSQSRPIISTSTNPSNQMPLQVTNDMLNSNCQKISDLYPDFPNWKIIARLVKKNYRQFVSKSGQGKLTKVLNVQFMDFWGTKITGALFGDSAFQKFQALKQQRIYQVSKGQIRQDQYSKGKQYSKYTLAFTKQSQFKLCEQTALFPSPSVSLASISSMIQLNIGQQYDVAAILMQIHEQVEIPKDTKVLYKQVLEIADPKAKIFMEAVVWNRGLKVERAWVGKTIGLFGFRLNKFNQKLSLNSSYTSQIRLLPNHQFKQYQGKIDKQLLDPVSQSQKPEPTEQPCKNLRQLSTQLQYLSPSTELKSTLTLFLSLISPKKFFYNSCPFCRKSAQPHSRCNNCEKYIEQTQPRYKLNVQLSDYCGSIWVTGFEELGTKLFADVDGGIKGLVDMPENERMKVFQKKLYQQLGVRLTSKIDRDGFIKHTVNRVYDANVMHRIEENIKRIKNHTQ